MFSVDNMTGGKIFKKIIKSAGLRNDPNHKRVDVVLPKTDVTTFSSTMIG